MSAKYRLSVTFGQNSPTQQSHGLFAAAKLLVKNYEAKNLLRNFRIKVGTAGIAQTFERAARNWYDGKMRRQH